MSDGTDAHIESISAFATDAKALTDEVLPRLYACLEDISGARIGMSGLSEGIDAARDHAVIVDNTVQYLNAASVGMLSLATGAQTIAMNYTFADAEQRDLMSTVTNAFNPTDGNDIRTRVQQSPPVDQDGDGTVAPEEQLAQGQLPAPTTTGPADTSTTSDPDLEAAQALEAERGDTINQYNGDVHEDLQTDGPPPPTTPLDALRRSVSSLLS